MAKDNKDTLKELRPISSDVLFERLSLKNEAEYIDFLTEAYKGQFSYYRFTDRELIKQSWHWEYIDNSVATAGNPPIWICRSKNKIIAQICFMPAEVRVAGRAYKGGW